MSPKQEIALETIARWADRFECIKSVVIIGSVALKDQKSTWMSIWNLWRP